MLRGRDVQDIQELKRQGLSIRAISRQRQWAREILVANIPEPPASTHHRVQAIDCRFAGPLARDPTRGVDHAESLRDEPGGFRAQWITNVRDLPRGP